MPPSSSRSDPLTSYYINIGSVDSFEKKLDDSQKYYNISPKDGIPLTYVQSPDYGSMIYKGMMAVMIVGSIGLTMSLMKGGAGGGVGGRRNCVLETWQL